MPNEKQKSYLIKVTGDVQGVNYRYWAQKTAKKLGISGWAKNEHDGSVTIFAQGEEEALKEMISWAYKGSPMSTVSAVSVEEAEPDPSLSNFKIK